MPPSRRPIAGAMLAAAVTLALVGLVVSIGYLSVPRTGSPPAQRDVSNLCSAEVTKTLKPDTIRLCEETDVTVGVRPSCPGLAVNIVFIIDNVYKIGYSNPADRTEALRNAVDRLGVTKQGNIRLGVVSMQDGGAVQKVALTTDANQVRGALNVTMISRFSTPPQCFECGYREAVKMFDDFVKQNPKTEVREFTILAPMGVYFEQSRRGIVSGANLVKRRGGVSISGCYAWTHCSPELRQAASDNRLYLAYGQGNRMAGLLYDVVRQSVSTFLHQVVLTDLIPDTVEIITGSVKPDVPLSGQPRQLRWTFDEPIEPAYTVTYRVKPLHLGTWKMGDGSNVLLVDSHYRNATAAVPAPELKVPVICQGSPTPSSTPPPTPSPTNTPTHTPTPTRTPTATPTDTPVPPTPTPTPGPVFLPVGVREKCVPSRTYSDIALVLDMSTTMRWTAPDGRRKVDAALDAARIVVADLDEAAGDRMAVVGFNRTAWIEQPLTGDAAAVRAALARLPGKVEELTRLDLAFVRGAEALQRQPGRAPEHRVMIVLTDGLPNQVPYAEDGTVATTVLRAASAAKADGIAVYTVGVGRADGSRRDVDPDLLAAAASRPGMYYHAPDAGRLDEIYAALVRVIPCGGGRYWSGR